MDLVQYMETILPLISHFSLKLISAIVIFIVGKWLSGKLSSLVSILLTRNKVDATLAGFLSNIIQYILIVVVLVAAAGQLGIDTTSFLTILGTAGLAIGLALKDSLSNFAAGVMLILFRPFCVGDYVTAGGVSGTVENITIFSTILSTPDNQKLIVPNGAITGGVITNVTANATRRVDITVGISYDDDIGKAKEVLQEILASEPRILETPPAKIAVMTLADSSVNLIVKPWVKTPDYWDVYFRLIETIKTTFDEQGITIPYPQQDVHLFTKDASKE